MKVPTPPPQCRSPPSAVSLVLNSVSTRATRITLNAFHAISGCVHARLVANTLINICMAVACLLRRAAGGGSVLVSVLVSAMQLTPPTPTPHTLLTHTPRLNRAGLRPHSSCSGRGRRQGTRDRHPANDEQCTTTKGKIGTLLCYMYVSVVFLRL